MMNGMHIETNNRKAFEFIASALSELDRFNLTKDNSRLDSASEKIDFALCEDPYYLRAIYVRGMVRNLQGKASTAIEDFETVLNANPPFINEVRYNLAVANYHRYSHQFLEKAIEEFKKALDNTPEESNYSLLIKAGLARAYAMRMIPKFPLPTDTNANSDTKKNDDEKEKGKIKEYFEEVNKIAVDVNSLLSPDLCTEDIGREIRWRILNAEATAYMYYSDYFDENIEKVKKLKKILRKLKDADKSNKENWVTYCNIASAHMRLAFWKRQLGASLWSSLFNSKPEYDFEQAIAHLDKVVNKIRVNYGFALYELGRVYRLKGEFETAIDYFDRTLKIREQDRDIRNPKLELEMGRAVSKLKDYP